jgi:hypothetical protein
VLASHELLYKDFDSFIRIFLWGFSLFASRHVFKDETISKRYFGSVSFISLCLEDIINACIFSDHSWDLHGVTHLDVLVIQIGRFYSFGGEFRTLSSSGEPISTAIEGLDPSNIVGGNVGFG